MPDAGYITPQLDVDQEALKARAYANFQARYPEASLPAEGSLLAFDIDTDAETAADTNTLVMQVAEDLAAWVLGNILQEPQRQPIAATSTLTVQVVGDTAVTIGAGEYFEATGPDGDPVTLLTLTPKSAAQGTTAITGIEVQAQDPGAATNGASGPVQGAESFPFAISATLDAPLTGGSDGEEFGAYLARLTELATLMAPQPIMAAEFARYAALKVEGVGRAIALDGTQPADPVTPGNPVTPGTTVNTGVERAVLVGITGTDGTAPSGAVALQTLQALKAVSVTSQAVTVATANYTTVNVAATVHVWPGYDADTIKASCADVLAAWLNPGTWGAPPQQGDGGALASLPPWEPQPTVRLSEVVERLGQVRGVDWTDPATVLLNGTNANLTLPGLLPLPLPGTFTITVQPR
jgi:hypothetical protein